MVTFRRKPVVNRRPWHCIACGVELPPERAQGRCRECLIGKRVWDEALSQPSFRKALDEGLADLAAGRTTPWPEVRERLVTVGAQAEAESALAEDRTPR